MDRERFTASIEQLGWEAVDPTREALGRLESSYLDGDARGVNMARTSVEVARRQRARGMIDIDFRRIPKVGTAYRDFEDIFTQQGYTAERTSTGYGMRFRFTRDEEIVLAQMTPMPGGGARLHVDPITDRTAV